MILYFDSYITDSPLHKNLFPGLYEIRNSCETYKMPKKIQVAMYTLASYSVIPWSDVLIRYELADKNQNEEFEKFVLGLFPKAKIIGGRSSNQKKFKQSVEILKQMGDDWIFYSGNNDHPFVANDLHTLQSCLDEAIRLKKRYRYVSIAYSHFSESLNAPVPGSPNHELWPDNKGSKVITEKDDFIVALYPKGIFDSLQIVHIDLLSHWFCDQDLKERRIIRSDDLAKDVVSADQAVVIPKKELCAHFDGYGHTIPLGFPLPGSLIPPLFIPNGFFEKKIQIAYGYPKYREGWANINPTAEKFVFEDQVNGTDLKLDLENIPLFWRDRITKVDVNLEADLNELKEVYLKRFKLLMHPWPIRSTAYYWIIKFNLILRRGIKKLEKLIGENK